MIVVTVETSIAFKTEEEFNKYLDSKECALITSFPEEIRIAFRTGKSVTYTTPRPEHGAITCSQVSVQKLGTPKSTDFR